jgi:predicted nucleic acid-binding protein
MRILIDTNIFINREGDQVLSENQQALSRILHEIGALQIVHPLSVRELAKNSNPEKQRVMISKIRAYPQLESPPDPMLDAGFCAQITPKPGTNDGIDDALLYCVYRDAVDYLITEDRKIIAKASRLGIDDRVFLISDALEFFRQFTISEKPGAPPGLEEDFIYNLNLADPIFDTLKKDYEEFESWFRKISRQGRKCWVHYNPDESIGALLIYKIENDPLNTIPPFPKRKRVKISTFIVRHIGQKIGELFIKLAVDIAIKNRTEEIYLTHFTKPEDRLVELITEYGFIMSAKNQRGEEIFIKKIYADPTRVAGLPPLEVSREYYPSFYDGPAVSKYFIPIWPENHERLFTDFKGSRQTKLPEHSGLFIIEGNTIKKAYLSHTKNKHIAPGDLVFFYRSKDLKMVTSLGVIETVHRDLEDADEIMKIVGKRTVYSRDEIERMPKPVTIIMFRHHLHVKNPVSFKRLKELDILTFAPQSITKISKENYNKLIEACGIDRRFTVH